MAPSRESPSRILLVEDDAAHGELIGRAFSREAGAWILTRVGSLGEAEAYLAERSTDLILADFRLPDGDGLDLLKEEEKEDAGGQGPARPVIILTSQGSEAVAAESIKRGALDYVVKTPETFAAMPATVLKALRAWDLLEAKRRTDAELRRSLAEKEVILKEVHHRVKNNFQIVSSLLSLQAGRLNDEASKAALLESEYRIKSMALIHEKLYESRDYARIDFADYLRTFSLRLDAAYRGGERGIALRYETENVSLSIETAIPLGLVLNELVTNCFIHAFPPGRQGRVLITLKSLGDHALLAVADDGVGLPEGLDLKAPKTLGMELVRILAAQAGGHPDIVSGPEGTTISILVPRLG